MPALLPDARDLLLAFASIAIDDDIVEGAMNEPAAGCAHWTRSIWPPLVSSVQILMPSSAMTAG
jgi:hypothetical protein